MVPVVPRFVGLFMLVLAISFAPCLAQSSGEGTLPVRYYFNHDASHVLLSELAPSSANQTPWTQSGSYDPQEGLDLRIPLVNPVGGLAVAEDAGVEGFLKISLRIDQPGWPVVFVPSERFEWRLIEGNRSSLLEPICPESTDNETCYQYDPSGEWRGDFPAHGEDAAPHTHGDGSDAGRPLYSDDFSWELRYKVDRCRLLLCLSFLGPYNYTLTLTTDGSTYAGFTVIPSESRTSASGVGPALDESPASEVPSGQDETAGGNASAPANSSRTYEFGDAAVNLPAPGLLAATAGVALVALLARRRPPYAVGADRAGPVAGGGGK